MTRTNIAVELGLDATAAGAVRALWDDLAGLGLAESPARSGVRPHITLAVYEGGGSGEPLGVDPVRIEPRLAAFAASLRPIAVRMSAIGTFPGTEGVVFLAPKVTRALLTAHARFHLRCADIGGACWPYYRPRQWVPHCTLAIGLAPEAVGAAVARCMGAELPISGHLTSLGVIRFRPGEHQVVEPLYEMALTGG